MPTRHTSRNRGNRGPRRKLVWTRFSTAQTVSTAASPGFNAPARIDVLGPFETQYGAQLLGATVMRTRGYLGISGLSTTSIQFVRFCMYVGNANDIVRGPNANDNAFDVNSAWKDYMLVEPFISPNSAVNGIQTSDVFIRTIDNRSKRKLEELDQSLILDVSGRSGAAADSFTFVADLSVLVALP